MARIRNLALLFTQPSYRRRTIVQVFAYFGGLLAVREALSQTLGEPYVRYANSLGILLVVAGLGALVVLFLSPPSDRYSFRHRELKSEIHLEVADLFKVNDDPVVITANRHFDSVSEEKFRGSYGAKIPRSSLIAQLEQRWFPNSDGHELARMITSQTGVEAGTVEHPVGSYVELRGPAGQHVILLAVSRRGDTTMSEVLIDEIWESLSALWKYMRRNGHRLVALPVIGSGHANAQVGPNPLLVLLLTSYVTAAMEATVGPIRIMVRETAHDLGAFELAQSYLESLGFKTRRR